MAGQISRPSSLRLRYQVFLLALALISAVPMSGCGATTHDRAESHILRRGLGGDLATLDPQLAGDTYSEQVIRDLFEGLIGYTAEGSIVPGLAADWQVSSDGLEYTFTLRDAHWSNGDPVLGTEVVEGLRRALSPATGAPAADSLRLIVNASDVLAGRKPPESLGVASTGKSAVQIRLIRPAPYFLEVLASPVAFPIYLGSKGLATSNVAGVRPEVVSNGAYRLSYVVPGDRVRLVKNESYWDAARTRVSAVEYLMISDVNAELLRFRSGDLDMTSTLPAGQIEWARRERRRELQSGPSQAMVYVVFDNSSGPLRDYAGLREALSLVIDREAITSRLLKGGPTAAWSIVSPGLGDYSEATYKWRNEGYESRISRARALYGKSGFSVRRPLKLRLMHHKNENNRNTALAVGAFWKEKLGVHVIFDEYEFKTFLKMRRDRGAWDAMVIAFQADYPDPASFLAAFESGAPDNDAAFSDPEFDIAFAAATGTPDHLLRAEHLRRAERIVLESYPVTPIYAVTVHRLVSSRVKGALLSRAKFTYTKHLRVESDSTKRP